MSASGFAPRQRRIVLLMTLIVVVVLALLTGFFITSLQSLKPAPVATPSPPTTTPVPSPTSPPTATPTAAPEAGIWPQVQAARLFDQIAHQVEMDRALAPQAEVPLSFLDDSEMRETLEQVYAEDDPRSALLPFTTLGLLPDAPVSVQAQAPAGIYVPEHRQLYVAIERSQDDRDAQMLMAHGYAHALQDQHFDLEAIDARAQTTDQRLAVEGLIEGDATLTTALYGSEDLSMVDWRRVTNLIVGAEQPLYSRPLAGNETWARLQQFPNEEGRAFAETLLEHGGWEAIDRAYTDLPRSTAAILHPSRYLGIDSTEGEPDAPMDIVVPDLGAALGEDWRLLLEDTLGEFVTWLHLTQVMPDEAAQAIADGWQGDKLMVWERAGGRRVLIWRTIWRSSREAADYEEGLRLLIPQRHYPVRPIDPPQGLPGRWWVGDRGTWNVRRTARYVLLARAPDTNTAINVLKGMP